MTFFHRENLRDYQTDLLSMIGKARRENLPGLLLAVEMGLGKTVVSLTAMSDLMFWGDIKKCLIVAPRRVAERTWPEEFCKWDHLNKHSFAVVCGNKKERIAALNKDAQFHIINRENLPWLYETLKARGETWKWDALIYDESSRLKAGKEYSVSGKISEYGVILQGIEFHKFQLLLTGTPAPGGIENLHAQIKILDGGARLETTLSRFRDRFMLGSKFYWYPRIGAQQEVMSEISDLMISMSADDHIKLPSLIVDNIIVDMPPIVRKRYQIFARTFFEKNTGTIAASSAVLIGKLLQFANGAIYSNDCDSQKYTVLHDAKIRGLAELVERANGENLLVAYSFKFDKDAILKEFPDAVCVDDLNAISKWNRGDIKMLIAHPSQIGHGLNLQGGGRHIVWFGMTWSLELYQQFNARLRRPGQTANTVFIHHILTRDTIDQHISSAMNTRGATQRDIMSTVKLNIGKSISHKILD